MTIKELRTITGLSQRAFGKKYHIPTRTIEDWEGGRRKPSETILYLLGRVVIADYEKEWKEHEEMKKYRVYWVAGERDGQGIARFEHEIDSIEFARQFLKDHESEFDPVCGGVMIINEETGEELFDW